MIEINKAIPITTLIVIYLYACGSLYLIGFWGIYEIDISSLVGITEVPKSFIMPLILSSGAMLVQYIFNIYNSNDPISSSEDTEINSKPKTRWQKIGRFLTSLNFLISLVFTGVLIGHGYFYKSPSYWLFAGLIVAYLVAYLILNSTILANSLPRKLRVFFVNIFVFTAIMSYCMGKSNGLKIFTNREMKLVSYISTKPGTDSNSNVVMKFIGFIGDKFVIGTVDNKEIQFINQADVSGLKIKFIDQKTIELINDTIK